MHPLRDFGKGYLEKVVSVRGLFYVLPRNSFRNWLKEAAPWPGAMTGEYLVVDGQQCNWFFFPASCLALITLVFECFPDIVTCMRHALLCQLEATIKAPIGSSCRRRTLSKLH